MRTSVDWYYDYSVHDRERLMQAEAAIRKEAEKMGFDRLAGMSLEQAGASDRITIQDEHLNKTLVVFDAVLSEDEILRIFQKVLHEDWQSERVRQNRDHIHMSQLSSGYARFLYDMDKQLSQFMNTGYDSKDKYNIYAKQFTPGGTIRSIMAVRNSPDGFPSVELEIDVRCAPGDMGLDVRFFELLPGFCARSVPNGTVFV